MNNLLEETKICQICYSSNLEYIDNYEHEDIMLNSYDPNEPAIMRIDDVVKCKDCDTLHFIENDAISIQFTPSLIKERKLNWVSDYQTSINKKLKTIV